MQAVVFDVGRVLIEWDVYHLYRKLLADDGAIKAFLDEVDFFAWNLECDRGTSFADAVSDLTARFPHHKALIEAFDARWPETVPGPIEGTVAILKTLKDNGVPLYAITNFSSEKWRLTRDRFDFLATSFIDVVVSGDEKMIKPDAEIFELFLGRNSLRAGDCLFIDDSTANVAGAKAVGLDALMFKDPTSLASELVERGLLSRHAAE
ncbi:MAG: HAD family phosphatase [Pseudomonadota bacterium]